MPCPLRREGDCTEGLMWTSLKQFETFAKKGWTTKFQLSQRMAEKPQSSCCLRILDAIHGFEMGIVWYCQLISWALVLAKGDFQVMIAAIQVLCPVLLGRSMEEAWNGKWQHVRFWSQTWSHLEWPRDTWSLHEFLVQCWFYVILQYFACILWRAGLPACSYGVQRFCFFLFCPFGRCQRSCPAPRGSLQEAIPLFWQRRLDEFGWNFESPRQPWQHESRIIFEILNQLETYKIH